MTRSDPVLLAFGFLSPALLGWLAAAAIPFVIHFWSRRRYREIPWAAMSFLVAALRASRRRILLERWLLLLIRMLIVVLIVLAAAEPYWEVPTPAATARRAKHILLIMDCSWSMQATRGSLSCFDKAKQMADHLVRRALPGDAFTLIALGNPSEIVVGEPAYNHEEFLRTLGELEIRHCRADLIDALRLCGEWLNRIRTSGAVFHQHEVWLFSDMQRLTWQPVISEWQQNSREHLGRLARQAKVHVIDVGFEGALNVGVTGLRVLPGFAVAREPLGIRASIEAFGPQRVVPVTVKLRADDRQVAQQELMLACPGESEVAFEHTFGSPGDHVLEIDLEVVEDELALDNRRWLVAFLDPVIRVLCIDGRPSGTLLGGASGYLGIALEPDPLSPSRIQVDVRSELALTETKLDDFHCVVLCDVPQLTASEAAVLRSFVGRGGGLIVFLGEQVQPSAYNRLLFEVDGAKSRLLPAELGRVISDNPQFSIDPLGYRHPILAAFRDHEKAGLLTTPVEKYYELIVSDNPAARTIARLANGFPWIVEHSVGEGRVILFASGADTRWTQWPKWPSFLPLVHEALAFAATGKRLPRSHLVGETIEGRIPDEWVGRSLRVKNPRGELESVQYSEVGGQLLWRYHDTHWAGVYTVEGEERGFRQLHSVNLDAEESDLARADIAWVQENLFAGISIDFKRSLEGPSTLAESLSGVQEKLSHTLLCLVLVLIVVESLLAWYSGRGLS